MRKFLVAALAATQIAGCSTISGEIDSVFGSGTSAKLIQDVSNATVALCSFVPDANGIAAIWTAATPLVNNIEATAAAICAAVAPPATPKSSLRGLIARIPPGVRVSNTPPSINGAPVRGSFIH